MTTTDFIRRRALGLIHPDEPVRTILFRFNGSTTEWEEILIRGRYESIADQEMRFRATFDGAVVFADNYNPEATVVARNWRAA